MVQYIKYKDKKTGLLKWKWKGSIGMDAITGKQKNTGKSGFSNKRDAIKDFEKRTYEFKNSQNIITNKDLKLGELLELYKKIRK